MNTFLVVYIKDWRFYNEVELPKKVTLLRYCFIMKLKRI